MFWTENKMGQQKASWEASTNGKVSLDTTEDQKTDYSKWRLNDEQGRQSWRYLESDEEAAKWPQTTAEKHFLGLDIVSRNRILSLLSSRCEP